RLDRRGEGFDVVGAVLAAAVDEGRGARHSAGTGPVDVIGHPGRRRHLCRPALGRSREPGSEEYPVEYPDMNHRDSTASKPLSASTCGTSTSPPAPPES